MVDRTISNKRIVRTEPVEVSVVSTLPPGLDEGKYRVTGLLEEGVEEAFRVSGVSDEELPNEGPPGEPAPEDTSLDIPKNIYVKSETYWWGDGGIPFVDVVLGFDGAAGAHAYEVRFAAE